MLTVSKNSALFKTYNALAKLMLFSSVTPLKYTGETDAFRDLCTFLRTTLFYLLISIPSWVLLIFAIFNVVYELVLSVLNFKLEITTAMIVTMGGLATAIGLLGLVLFILFTIAEKVTGKAGDSDFINMVTEAVKSKHEKVCKIIKVVDKK